MNRHNRAVFLDKDGTLLINDPYNVDPDRMRLAPTAERALSRLGALPFALIVVSNQPGVALGRFGLGALLAVERRLARMFECHGGALSGFYYCPHHPAGTVPEFSVTCLCRKPLPGLLHLAAARHGIDLNRSWMIGDILDDVEAGNRGGCHTIMVECGGETEWSSTPTNRWLRTSDFTVADIDTAARIVVSHASRPPSGMEPRQELQR